MEAPTWKKVIAFLIDLIGSFIAFGYLIGFATGNIQDGGFQLHDWVALLLFVVMILYFVLMNKLAGGTVGKYLLGIAHKK